MKKISSLIVLSLVFSQAVEAAPEISGVSGLMVHGDSFVVSGQGFLEKNPAAPVWWDDAEQRNVNNPSELTAASIWDGRHYQSVSPPANQWADMSGTEENYHSMQYRSNNFRFVSAPHDRSMKYIAGGHNTYKLLSGSNGYRWVTSTNGVNEYRVELLAGGDPQFGLNDNYTTCLNGSTNNCVGFFRRGEVGSSTYLYQNRGTLGSLSDHQWGWGDNDGLGYATWYYRDDSGDPDTTAINLWGGTGDESAGDTGADVIAMVCVPPQGGTANCSQSQTWTNLFVSYYTRWDPLWPTPVNAPNNNNEKLQNFETSTSFYIQPDYFTHTPDATANSVYGVGLGGRGWVDSCSSATGWSGCFKNPISGWTRQDWRIHRDDPITNQDSIEVYVRDGENAPVLAVDQTASGVISQTANLTGYSIGGYYCHADHSDIPQWQPNTHYPLHAKIRPASGSYTNIDSYVATTGGTSGSTEPSWTHNPQSYPSNVTDGEVVWSNMTRCQSNNSKDGHPNAFRYFDDIYIDNTWSRAMLCNNQDFLAATICEPQIPTAWDSGSITATVNLGQLPDEGTAYLFIFDSADDRNQDGYPVILGDSSDITPPSGPVGLAVQ